MAMFVAAIPTPDMETVSAGWAGLFVVMVRTAASAPTAVGANVTVKVQLLVTPGFTVTQSGANVKSAGLAPVTVMPEIFKAAVPELEIVTCAVCPFDNVVVDVFTLTLPNTSDVGVIPAIGTGRIVATFDHPESKADVLL